MTDAKMQALQDIMDCGFIILEDDEFAFQEDCVDAECDLAELVQSNRPLSVNRF